MGLIIIYTKFFIVPIRLYVEIQNVHINPFIRDNSVMGYINEG